LKTYDVSVSRQRPRKEARPQVTFEGGYTVAESVT